MSRAVIRALAAALPVLGLTAVASDGVAEGVDRFAWPLAGSRATGNGFDHDRDPCPTIEQDDGTTKCDPDVAKSDYVRDKSCGSAGAYDQHTGTDAYAPADDPSIYAAAAGVVISSIDEYGTGSLGSNDGSGFGNSVVLYHGNGLASLYGHMLKGSGLPAVGEWIECGEALGEQGSSGNSSAAHLHFDVRTGVTVSSAALGGYFSGVRVDPFDSEQDDEGQWCGASSSMWVEHTDTLPSRDCDEDEYIGQACSSATVGMEVDDGSCVQNSACAWSRCVDGAWLGIGDGVTQVCEATNYAFEACEAIDCAAIEGQAACDAWVGSCGWSCEQEACVDAEQAEGDECVTEPPAACDDGVLNGEETGLDCGGPECLGCDGDPCVSPDDCASGSCGDDGSCGPPPFDCHRFDGDPETCGNATGCIYHECADACSPNTETACAAGCEDQCGTTGCLTATSTYFSSNTCITGPATGIAQLYRNDPSGGMPVLEGQVGLGADGRFCVDLQVGSSYYLYQADLPTTGCGEGYTVGCSLYLGVEPGTPGVDGVCAEQSSCEDLGALEFDCGS
ncbi:MAG: M23 family metallopeptidase [Nannocystaceae bacterium]